MNLLPTLRWAKRPAVVPHHRRAAGNAADEESDAASEENRRVPATPIVLTGDAYCAGSSGTV